MKSVLASRAGREREAEIVRKPDGRPFASGQRVARSRRTGWFAALVVKPHRLHPSRLAGGPRGSPVVRLAHPSVVRDIGPVTGGAPTAEGSGHSHPDRLDLPAL